MPHLPGRPREFTHQRRRELIDHIGQGATLEEAAQIVGVSLRTVQREARHNECFDHDLQLAIHAAPVDAYKLVTRAARTHWRAAAWLLERTDPDRFARRPPNSCSPETLQDFGDWLIETALEAVSPDQRSVVYGRMRAVADKAFDVVMPDQHDTRRRLVGSLPHRPMPLSDHEYCTQRRTGGDRPATAAGPLDGEPCGLPEAPATDEHDAPAAHDLAAPTASEHALPAAGEHPAPAAGKRATPAAGKHAAPAAGKHCATPADVAPRPNVVARVPGGRCVADPIAYYRWHERQPPSPEPPGDSVGGFRLQDSDLMDASWRYPLAEEEEDDAADVVFAGLPTRPPERGNYVAKNVRGDKRCDAFT